MRKISYEPKKQKEKKKVHLAKYLSLYTIFFSVSSNIKNYSEGSKIDEEISNTFHIFLKNYKRCFGERERERLNLCFLPSTIFLINFNSYHSWWDRKWGSTVWKRNKNSSGILNFWAASHESALMHAGLTTRSTPNFLCFPLLWKTLLDLNKEKNMVWTYRTVWNWFRPYSNAWTYKL